ncbi:MAG: hypothetical protein KDJ71_01135 [Nitrobacter sp.]|nr:hypothetical protein [Nitrobacter sp.]
MNATFVDGGHEPAMSQIRSLLANKNYAQAYDVALNDLNGTYGGLELNANDQDVVHWLDIAQQVNSGSQCCRKFSFAPITKPQLHMRKVKQSMFLDRSNRPLRTPSPRSFFKGISADNALPDFSTIQRFDAGAGPCVSWHQRCRLVGAVQLFGEPFLLSVFLGSYCQRFSKAPLAFLTLTYQSSNNVSISLIRTFASPSSMGMIRSTSFSI